MSEGAAKIKLKARKYPTEVSIAPIKEYNNMTPENGAYLIQSIGNYEFKATHIRKEGEEIAPYNGTQSDEDGGVWTIEGADPAIKGTINPNDWNKFTVAVTKLPDELDMLLKFKSNWKCEMSLEADPVELKLIAVINTVLMNNLLYGNPALFRAVELYGVNHESPDSYNSLELRDVVGEFDISGLLQAGGINLEELKHFESNKGITSDKYNVLKFLKNVTELIIDDCTEVPLLNVSEMPQLVSASLKNTTTSFYADEDNLELR